MPRQPTPSVEAITDFDNRAVSYTGIPDPTTEVSALLATCVAMKEAIETITRQRGNIANSAVFLRDLERFIQLLDERYETGLQAVGVGHVIQDEGIPLPQRANLNFTGDGITASDDAGNNATVVTVASGPGGGDVVQDGSVGATQIAIWSGNNLLGADSSFTWSGRFLTIFNPVVNQGPLISLGADTGERAVFEAAYVGGTQDLNILRIQTRTASGVANRGAIEFEVDQVLRLRLDDNNVNINARLNPVANGAYDIGQNTFRFATAWLNDIDVSGDIVVGGTVDGRNVSVDGATLDALVLNGNAPAGGDTGEILIKQSNIDFDYVWAIPDGGTF